MEKITVQMPAGYTGKEPIVVHELTGTLPDPINMKSLSIAGNIDAVSNWIATRQKFFKSENAHILIDGDAKSITLVIDEHHPLNTTVTGKFTDNPELSKFGINTNKRYSPSELAQVLKLNRMFFPDRQVHQSLLKNLKQHEAKITAQINDKDDDRGNTEASINTQLASNVDEKFTLEMPIFKGSPEKVKFEVNIGIEVRDKGITLWLDSVELKELTNEKMDIIMNTKIKEYRDAGFTVIIK